MPCRPFDDGRSATWQYSDRIRRQLPVFDRVGYLSAGAVLSQPSETPAFGLRETSRLRSDSDAVYSVAGCS